MITVKHIEDSINNALNGVSNLTYAELSVRGFSTPTIRRLFNNLCNIDGKYLEVGLFCGGTFVSSFNKNLESIGIENYAQDFSVSTVKDELTKNIEDFKHKAKNVSVHYEDCFSFDKSKLPNNVDIYFFDGEHSFESQAKALPYYLDSMNDTFLWVVDDALWDTVRNGTRAGLELLSDKIEIQYEKLLVGNSANDDAIWHNGLSLYLINKK